MAISLPGYVGAATVAAAAWWFLYSDDGPMVTFHQLVSIKHSTLWYPASQSIQLLLLQPFHENLQHLFTNTLHGEILASQ